MRIPALLEEIAAFYREHAPIALEQTLEPATVAEVDTIEAELGRALPEDLRLYLLHNRLRHSFVGNFDALSAEGMRMSREVMNGLLQQGVFEGRVERWKAKGFSNWDDGRIQPAWWDPGWLPFAEDSCGNMKCIDLSPGPSGVLGQVVAMEVQDAQGPFATDCRSITAFLEQHLGYLQAGKFQVYEHGIEVDPWA